MSQLRRLSSEGSCDPKLSIFNFSLFHKLIGQWTDICTDTDLEKARSYVLPVVRKHVDSNGSVPAHRLHDALFHDTQVR